MTDITQQTLASLASDNHRVVPVFEKYELDFCCNGKRTLAAACKEKGIDLTAIAGELQSVPARGDHKQMPFKEMSAEQLIGHIETNHHFYVKQSMPVIHDHLGKVAAKHGDRYHYMKVVLRLFSELQAEMTEHLQKEESTIFPGIIAAEKLFRQHGHTESSINEILEPVSLLETEHAHAGDIMFKIRAMTNNYTAPEGACNTFKVSLAELNEFEADLHRHVHLENNILFPKTALLFIPAEQSYTGNNSGLLPFKSIDSRN